MNGPSCLLCSYKQSALGKYRLVKFKLYCFLPNIEVSVIFHPFHVNKFIRLTCTSGPTANAKILHVSQCSPECLQPKQFQIILYLLHTIILTQPYIFRMNFKKFYSSSHISNLLALISP
jgi:hypothetical protein